MTATQAPARPLWHEVTAALLTLAEGKAELVSHSERPWASATFSGARHEVVLRFEGIEAAIIGEALIELLPEHEFAIGGQLVADCGLVWAERRVNPLQLTFAVSLLLLLKDE